MKPAKQKKKILKAYKKRKRAIRRWVITTKGRIILAGPWGRNRISKLLPYAPAERFSEESRGKAIVLAPHPDDEVFGCGLLMQELVNKNREIELVFITKGEAYSTQKGKAGLRKLEGDNSAKRFGVNVSWLEYEDKTLDKRIDELSSDLSTVFREHRPGMVVIPFFADYHTDHRALASAALKALQTVTEELQENITICMYSTFSPHIPVNGAGLKYIEKSESALLKHLDEYRYSAAPVIVKGWLMLRELTARRYLGRRIFWEPYLVFNTDALEEILNSAGRWPGIYPRLVKPQLWEAFIKELEDLSGAMKP